MSLTSNNSLQSTEDPFGEEMEYEQIRTYMYRPDAADSPIHPINLYETNMEFENTLLEMVERNMDFHSIADSSDDDLNLSIYPENESRSPFADEMDVCSNIGFYIVEPTADRPHSETKTFYCPVCLQDIHCTNSVMTNCDHQLCHSCMVLHLTTFKLQNREPTCAMCRTPYSCLETYTTEGFNCIQEVLTGTNDDTGSEPMVVVDGLFLDSSDVMDEPFMDLSGGMDEQFIDLSGIIMDDLFTNPYYMSDVVDEPMEMDELSIDDSGEPMEVVDDSDNLV